MNMKDLIRNIVESLVDYPEDVNVTEVNGETVTVLELRVAKADLGKIIGRQGNTARSMRTILAAMAKKVNKRVVLEIIE
jgi:hypothetical protein